MLPAAAYAVQILSAIQHELLLCGDVAEIGGHSGKFFIALAHTTTPMEHTLVIDPISEQNGGGEALQVLSNNLRRFSVDPTETEGFHVLEESPLEVLLMTVEEKAGPFRIFSVDGSRNAEHMMNNLDIAARTLVEGGIIVVDDWEGTKWVGVHEGVYRYLLTPDFPPLAPFLFMGKKLFLTTPAYQGRYFDALGRSRLWRHIQSEYGKTEMMGWDIWVDAANKNTELEQAATLQSDWENFVQYGKW
ncbi:hypothetical protein HDV00_006240 [Rhizophlyctis rosea]|nr:hypothetical protein HDV00_006240 [Rhizophlyctis rosea]